MSKILVKKAGKTQEIAKQSVANRAHLPNYWLVQRIDCLPEDGEDCFETLIFYPAFYICEFTDVDGITREAVAAWDEANNKEIYVALEEMPDDFKLFNYEAYKALNECFGERGLSLPRFVLEEKFAAKSYINRAIKNAQGHWDFINGKMKDHRFYEFEEVEVAETPELEETEEEEIIEEEE